LLEDRFNRIVANAQRHPQYVAVLFIDLDGFKQINDTLGHHVGDALLCIVAERLRDNVRISDTVSRHGGDEFICLLAELTSADAAAKIAETILDELQRPAIAAGHSLTLTASIGISIYPNDGEHLAGLMARSDTAMYQAKRSGRNRYMFYKP
jgi:diguanylate cyclase (GGDEF)-like protein